MSMQRQPLQGTMPQVAHGGEGSNGRMLTFEQRAAICYSRGEREKALEMYREAARLSPGDSAVQKAYADFVYVALGRPTDALPLYRHVLDLKPGDAETLHILGNLCATQQKPDEARLYFKRLLDIEPWNMAAKKALQALPAQVESTGSLKEVILSAQRSVSAGEEERVNAALDLIVQMKREAIASHTNKQPEHSYDEIRTMASSGKHNEAIAALEQLLSHAPDNALAHNDLGVLYTNAGNTEKALRHYRRAVDLDPGSVVYQKNLADLLFVAHGDAEEALKMYVQILRSNPKDVEALGAIATICATLGRPQDAQSFYNLILDIEPWNQAIRRQRDALQENSVQAVSYENAQTLARAGKTVQACQMLEEFVASSPAHAAAHNDLGVLYYQLGFIEKAQAEYEQAVRLDPENLTLQKNLAEYYSVAKGRNEDALRILVEILRKQPRDADTLMSIGKICEVMGRADDAQDFFKKALEVEPWNQYAREQLQHF
jgi:tetratricopeptide (TPR) repeat protein